MNVWLRLFEVTGEGKWLGPVPAALRFLKSTQNRLSKNLGLRGGIKGCAPFGASYCRHQVLGRSTSLFAEALMRHDRAKVESPVIGAVAEARAAV